MHFSPTDCVLQRRYFGAATTAHAIRSPLSPLGSVLQSSGFAWLTSDVPSASASIIDPLVIIAPATVELTLAAVDPGLPRPSLPALSQP